MRYAITIIALLIALPALAADPECASSPYNEAVDGQYDATQSIRFCTAETGADGEPLGENGITKCTVKANGYPFAITSSNRPGQYVAFDTPQSVKDYGSVGGIEVFCENTAGIGASVVALNARFRGFSVPGAPTLRK